MNMQLLVAVFYFQVAFCVSDKPFVATFQDGIINSDLHVDDHFLEYTGQVPQINNFTACHWMNIKYFSKELIPIWSYCMQRKDVEEFECLQLSFVPIPSSSNRNLKTEALLPWSRVSGSFDRHIAIEVKPFKHRAWTHICWAYSSGTGCHQIYYNGDMMESVCTDIGEETRSERIESSSDVSKHSVIIGQEQDSIGGSFDSKQTFNGQLTELNIWGKVLSHQAISDLSKCKQFVKGDIIPWRVDKFKVHNVTITYLKDISFLCREEKYLVIFPHRHLLSDAKDICQIHGGSLVVPKSQKENNDVIKLLNMHKRNCFDVESCTRDNGLKHHTCNMNQPVAWLGLEQKGSNWYEIDNTNSIKTTPVSYDNFEKGARGYGDAKCAFMENGSSGKWRYGTTQKCNNVVLKLCPICHVVGTPIFTAKGVVIDKTWVDFNFYLEINSTGQVEYYEGYKTARLKRDRGSGRWKFFPKNGTLKENIELPIRSSTIYPVGRFQWDIYSDNVNTENVLGRSISFSVCRLGEEFTCNSGHCIEQSKRCNHVKDCNDGSDEENCTLLDIPNEYLNTKPPEPEKGFEASVKLHTQIKIISIDSIDTANMLVALTLELRVRWADNRLTYRNLVSNEKNFIPFEEAAEIWLPLENIIFENCDIEETYEDKIKDIVVHATNPIGTDCGSYEDSLYNGSSDSLEMMQIFKVKYACVFHLFSFPFDWKNCKFVLKMRRLEKLTTRFVADNSTVIYNGLRDMHQFNVGVMKKGAHQTKDETKLIFTIALYRNYMHQIFATFFPTLLLWLLAYATLFIDINDFDNRFNGSVTALLVLAALLNSITTNLPKTSYFKLIDLWFLWHILGIFLIIILHIILDKVNKSYKKKYYDEAATHFNQNGITDEEPQESEDTSSTCLNGTCMLMIKINYIAIFILPMKSLVFYVLYFYYMGMERNNAEKFEGIF